PMILATCWLDGTLSALRRARKPVLPRQWTVAPTGCYVMEIRRGLAAKGHTLKSLTRGLGSSLRKAMDCGFPGIMAQLGSKLWVFRYRMVVGSFTELRTGHSTWAPSMEFCIALTV